MGGHARGLQLRGSSAAEAGCLSHRRQRPTAFNRASDMQTKPVNPDFDPDGEGQDGGADDIDGPLPVSAAEDEPEVPPPGAVDKFNGPAMQTASNILNSPSMHS